MDYNQKPTRGQWVRDVLYCASIIGGAWVVAYAIIGVLILLAAGFVALIGAAR